MAKKKAIILDIAVLKIVGILMGLFLMMLLSMLLYGNLFEDYDKLTESKAIEIRNAMLYLNTVEEGVRVVSVDKDFKVILEKQNITVECHKKFFCDGDVSYTLMLAPINKDIIEPATLEATSICISKKIHNCHNTITMCIEDEDCCKLEKLTDTLCASTNPYD